MVLIRGTFALQAKQRNQAWEAHSTASRHDGWQRVRGFGQNRSPFSLRDALRCPFAPYARDATRCIYPMSALGQKRTFSEVCVMSVASGSRHSPPFNPFVWQAQNGSSLVPIIFGLARLLSSSNYPILGKETGRALRPWLITACKRIQQRSAFPRSILIFYWATPC